MKSNLEPVNSEHVKSEVKNKPTNSTLNNSVTYTFKNKSDANAFKEECKICSNRTNINKTTTTEYTLTSTGKSAKTNRPGNLILAASNVIPTYDVGPIFHSDDEDIRSDSKNYYYNWPYYYNTPYDYDNIKYDIEFQKAKDKRFIESKFEKIIPVHEDIDDIPNSYVYTGPNYMYNTHNSDNPIYGNKPFFSSILSDYFDKSYDDDPFTFKDISWGKEFDKETLYQNMDDYDKQIKYLDDEYPNHFEKKNSETPTEFKLADDDQRNTLKIKKYGNKNEFDAFNKDNNYQEGYENGKKLYGKYLKEFKDFTDSFANKFGSQDHNKISTYSMKNNADKGEKKRGLRKVFHKDEYQEETESIDDNNKASNFEEHGASRIGAGGLEAYLQSKAAAALGKYQDSIRLSNIGSDLDLYKDIAKNLASINNDNFDRYMN